MFGIVVNNSQKVDATSRCRCLDVSCLNDYNISIVRVISGKFKGHKLSPPKSDKIRPTTDRVKESMFNILSNRGVLEQACVLDLFCGSGALGIEALSHGASSVTFVDKDADSIALAKSNIKKIIDSDGDYNIFCVDYSTAIKNFAQNFFKFDLILLDPPYNKNIELQALQKILDNNILKQDGIVVLEVDKKTDIVQFCLQNNLKQKEYKLGNTKLVVVSFGV